MRYVYALTSALLLGGATATLALAPGATAPGAAQTAQNEPGAIQAAAPKAGAPMSFADMVAKLQPAVVNISTKQTIVRQAQANPFAGTPFEGMMGQGQGGPQRQEGQSLGSGFIISTDGYVVTNNHVVAPGTRGASVDSITVTLPDRKEYTAKLIGRDAASDLALLKITAPGPLPFVRFGDSTSARVGDWVVAIGNPFGLGGTVTAGIVSALHRATGLGAYDRFIQTDAAINQGNSGGPMFNIQGDVIGINSQILGSQTGGNIGIGFAIPAEQAKPIIDKLMSGQKIQRGYLGITIRPVSGDIAGALGISRNQGEIVLAVQPDGPGARAGLRVGDVIVKVGGKSVTPDETLSYLIAAMGPGSTTKIDLIREGKPLSVATTIVARPSEERVASILGSDENPDLGDNDSSNALTPTGKNSVGLTVVPLTPQVARAIGIDSSIQGVVVSAVDPVTDAGSKVQRGDVIQSVNSSVVRSQADIIRLAASAKAQGRDQVLLLVTRKGAGTDFIPLKLN